MSALQAKTRLLRAALEGLEAKSQASEIEPADVSPLVEVAFEIEREALPTRLEDLAQRLALLEASALRLRVAGPLFSEIHDLRTEVLTQLHSGGV
jgi:hypothetical protein